MRYLVILRGAPGSGKSQWAQTYFAPYTLSTDNIRLLLQSPVTDIYGNTVISQKNNKEMAKLLMKCLEERMSRGEFIVLDATHAKPSSWNKYNDLIKKYRYRAVILEFRMDLPTLLQRNKTRVSYKQVPEDVIKEMHEQIEKNPAKSSSRFDVYPKKDGSIWGAVDVELEYPEFTYKEIVIFGDIHGCFTPLDNYFKKHPFDDEILYIFTGDYLDRGLENGAVLEFMLSIYDKPNVICLEANHERWLRLYASKNEEDLEKIKSEEFVKGTIPQIQHIDKAEIRQFCRKLRQLVTFTYGSNKYVVTHAGVPCVPTKLTPSFEFIKGTGTYEDIYEVEKSFAANTPQGIIQVHGHRNPKLAPITTDYVNYNLCEEVEFGGDLRILSITPSRIIPLYYGNPNGAKRNEKSDIVERLDNSSLIKKHECSDGIVSYNFSKEAFYDKRWNSLTCKARGLFLRGGHVVARGYSKFFNVDERRETKVEALCENMQFPVKVYLKYNGFLGMVSVNEDDLRVFTKSRDDGPYVDYFKSILFDTVSVEQIKQVAKDNNLTNHTFIFECIDPENDPHIIEYDQKKVVLLDIAKNSFEDNFESYDVIKKIARELDLECKSLEKFLHDPDELRAFIEKYQNNGSVQIEGFVLEDSAGFRVKLKTEYYAKWKHLRGYLYQLKKNPEFYPRNMAPDEKDVFEYMRKIDLTKYTNIIDLRKDFDVEKIWF